MRDVNSAKGQLFLMYNIPVVNNWTSHEHQGWVKVLSIKLVLISSLWQIFKANADFKIATKVKALFTRFPQIIENLRTIKMI